MTGARLLLPADIHVGMQAEFEREVSESDVLGFAANSGDANPLHVDAQYAASTNYGRPIVHGAFQIGLASAMIGMHLPGQSVLLMTVQAKFPSPLNYPSRVRVRGVVTLWDPVALKGVLRTSVEELPSGRVTAEVHTGFTFHDRISGGSAAAASTPSASTSIPATIERAPSRNPILLLTGASGGLGSELTRALCAEYRILALVHRRSLPPEIASLPNVSALHADLSGGIDDALALALGDEPLAGVVHVAWPGSPHGGLLDTPETVLREQLDFGSTQLIRLARVAYARMVDGGTIVALGSTYGRHKPQFSLASYSLGKSLLEDTVAMLAPELAKRRITINAVCPAVVASGLNAQMNDRQKLREAATIPLGRLCETNDVSATVRFLLSSGASFISGQSIYLTGGQL
jgi:NAD(P)-dependent dehydrogenase (short-subunit alcohol dehydrogenase family)/acyl dehydratase